MLTARCLLPLSQGGTSDHLLELADLHSGLSDLHGEAGRFDAAEEELLTALKYATQKKDRSLRRCEGRAEGHGVEERGRARALQCRQGPIHFKVTMVLQHKDYIQVYT